MKYTLVNAAIVGSVSALPGYFYNNITPSGVYPTGSSQTISSMSPDYSGLSRSSNESASTSQNLSPSITPSASPASSQAPIGLASDSSAVSVSVPSSMQNHTLSSQPTGYPISTPHNISYPTGYSPYPEASKSIEYPSNITKTITSTLYSWIPCSTPVAYAGKTTFYSTYLTASTYTTVFTKVYPYTPAASVIETTQPTLSPAANGDDEYPLKEAQAHPSAASGPDTCPAAVTSTVTVYYQMPVTVTYTVDGKPQTTVITPPGSPEASTVYNTGGNEKPAISNNTPEPSPNGKGPEPLQDEQGYQPSQYVGTLNLSLFSVSSGYSVPSYTASSPAPYPTVTSSCSSSSSSNSLNSTALPSPSDEEAYSTASSSSSSSSGEYSAQTPSPSSHDAPLSPLSPSSSSQPLPAYVEYPVQPSPTPAQYAAIQP